MYKMTSKEACKIHSAIAPEGIDWVYIDADQDYEEVFWDIENWGKAMKGSGILSGYDYSDLWPGVIRAVDEYALNHGGEVKTFIDSSWIILR